MLERVSSTKDRRIVNVELMPAGKQMTQDIKSAISEQVAEWPETIGSSDAKRINNSLACLINMGRLLAEKK